MRQRQIRWVLSVTLASLTGCTSLGVEPWDRDILARDDMQLVADPLEAATDDHIYFGKQ